MNKSRLRAHINVITLLCEQFKISVIKIWRALSLKAKFTIILYDRWTGFHMFGRPLLVSWAIAITGCGQARDQPFPASLLPAYHWSSMNVIIVWKTIVWNGWSPWAATGSAGCSVPWSNVKSDHLKNGCTIQTTSRKNSHEPTSHGVRLDEVATSLVWEK
jgi:hypothetical protein